MSPDNDPLKNSLAPLAKTEPINQPQTTPGQQAAAADVVRSQIDSLYTTASPQATPVVDINPYDRTHDAHPQPDLDQWKQYHSAWQTYYQKYYEGYYNHHLSQAIEKEKNHSIPDSYFTTVPDEEIIEETLSKDEALFELRQKLLSKVSESAKKVRKSRHFVPISAAIIVVLVFAFLQYNQLIVANVLAYVSPGSINLQNIVVDPSADVNVSADPRLIIPKINVDVPVLYDISNDYTSQMAAMQKGVAQFAIPGASSHPGQIGNTVIAGHSSNDLIDPGDYKFIFAQLEKLQVGDTIYANYQSKRYTYTITKKEVVVPTDVSALVYDTGGKPVITLLTCTPLGTSTNRLLITGQQVSPDSAASIAAPTKSTQATTSIPGTTPSIFERLFGSNG
jgi:sortase A